MTSLRIAALAAALAACLDVPVWAIAGGRVPCEPLPHKLTAAFKTSTASGADKAKAKVLQVSGLAKCKIDDDAEAVADFLAAFKLLGVKP